MSQQEIIALSEEIKLQRFKKKKTQEECANILHISIPTYKNIEDCPNKMNLDQAIILSNFLECNLLEFFLKSILHNAI